MRFSLYLPGLLLCVAAGLRVAAAETPGAEAVAEAPVARPGLAANRPNTRALLDMFASLEALRQEINTLRGAIEVQTYNLEQLQQKQRELYSDIDRRLQRLEAQPAGAGTGLSVGGLAVADAEVRAEAPPEPAPGGVAAVARPEAAPLTSAAPGPAEPPADPQVVMPQPAADPQAAAPPLAAPPPAAPPPITPDQQAEAERPPPDPVRARADYQRAFQLLKEAQYSQALAAFTRFLADYPDSAFSDNAQYWLAETHYVLRDYAAAIEAYQALLGTYPDSQKISHAWLKIGYSQAELGQDALARETLEKVIARYPGTTVARLADERLKKAAASAQAGG